MGKVPHLSTGGLGGGCCVDALRPARPRTPREGTCPHAHPQSRSTRLAAVVGLVAAGLAAGVGAAAGSPGTGPDDARREIARASSDDTTQVVMVRAPEVEDRNEVIGLGLDVTEHATRRGIEVVLHDAEDAQVLKDAGFTWTVTVADLEAVAEANRQADKAYAASVARSAPARAAARPTRTYDDYVRDLNRLARTFPDMTRPLTPREPDRARRADPRHRGHPQRRQRQRTASRSSS